MTEGIWTALCLLCERLPKVLQVFLLVAWEFLGELPYLMYHVALEFGDWILARGLQLFHHLLPVAYQAKLVVWHFVEELSYVLYQVVFLFGEWTTTTLTFLSCGVAQLFYYLLLVVYGSSAMAWQLLRNVLSVLYQAVTSVVLLGWHVGNHLSPVLLVVWHVSQQLLYFAYKVALVFGEWMNSRLTCLVCEGVEWLNHIHPVLLIRDGTLAMWHFIKELSYVAYQVAHVLLNWTYYCGVQLLSAVRGVVVWTIRTELLCLVYQSLFTLGKWIHSKSIFLANGTVQLFSQLLSSIYGAVALIWQGLEELGAILRAHVRGELLFIPILIVIVVTTSLWLWSRRKTKDGAHMLSLTALPGK